MALWLRGFDQAYQGKLKTISTRDPSLSMMAYALSEKRALIVFRIVPFLSRNGSPKQAMYEPNQKSKYHITH